MYKAIKQEPGFWCDLCGKRFSYKKSLDEHQLSHDVELVNNMSVPPHLLHHQTPTITTYASQNSSTPNVTVNSPMDANINSSVHAIVTEAVRTAATKLKPHACDQCGKSYTRKDHLNRHKLEHTGVRPHVCCVCMKAFIRKDKLQRHERTHVKDREYKICCLVCGKKFLRKDGLNKHSKTHTMNSQINHTATNTNEQTGNSASSEIQSL